MPEISGEFGFLDLRASELSRPGMKHNYLVGFFLLNTGIIRKHGELKLSHNVKPVIIALEGAAKKSLTILHEEYPVKI